MVIVEIVLTLESISTGDCAITEYARISTLLSRAPQFHIKAMFDHWPLAVACVLLFAPIASTCQYVRFGSAKLSIPALGLPLG